jgi:FKBP-type peptidyl-prolyl cis-trans isomerase FklB
MTTKLSFSLFITILFTMLGTQEVLAQKNLSKMDSVSYSVGVLFANNLKQQGLSEVDLNLLVSGLQEAMRDNAKITPEEANQMVNAYIGGKREKEMNMNLEAGKQFLVENATKEGVVVLESGLQYKILQAGDGQVPTAKDRVTVHYHGTLIDGTVFDSSIQRGEPATFGVTQVIQGWVEALQLMPKGSKWRLFIPANLAYGNRSAGSLIKPNSALIFDVELLDIAK